VVVGETQRESLAGSSRYCRGRITYPPPSQDEPGFVDAIVRAVADEGIDLVVPTADLASAILAEHRSAIEPRARVAVVDPERFWAASDKNLAHRMAIQLGIPSPTLHFVDGPDAALALQDRIPFPCVVKPSRSHFRQGTRWVRTSVRRIESKAEYVAVFRDRLEFQIPCMVQREVQGDGQGIFALCREGDPLVLFAHRRLREKPPWGGVSVLRESVPLEPHMRDFAVRLLREIRWHGVAMVEFKREASTGVPYLMEVNARLWGSLQLAIDAGIDFPLLLVQLYLDGEISIPPPYRVGVRSRWLLGDLDHLLARLSRRREAGSPLPPLSRLLSEFFWPFQRGTRLEVESRRDMGPSCYEIHAYVRDALGSLRRAPAHRPSKSSWPEALPMNHDELKHS
jgi:predicted ATP-grasp superfamily ATP-dependent carboligase